MQRLAISVLTSLQRMVWGLLLPTVSWAGQNDALDEYQFLLGLPDETPWMIEFEANNTGNSEHRIRERLTAQKENALTDLDFLQFDFFTDGFNDSNGLYGLYQAILGDSDWEIELTGFHSNETYRLSGVTAATEDTSYGMGSYLNFKVYGQESAWSFGAGFRQVEVSIEADAGVEQGYENSFLLLGVKGQYQFSNQNRELVGLLQFERNQGALVGTQAVAYRRPFKGQIDENFNLISWHSHWREFLFKNQAGLPGADMSFSFNGQTAGDHPIYNQFQQSLGGASSVRGYEDEIVSGGEVWWVSVEPAWYFRTREAQLRMYLFMDYGRVEQVLPELEELPPPVEEIVHILFPQSSHTLHSVGLGYTLDYRDRLEVNLAWGKALRDDEELTPNGDHYLHANAILSF